MSNKKRAKDRSQSIITEEIKEQVQKLVKVRLQAIPRHMEIAIGSKQYSRDDLLKSIEDEGSELGQQLMEAQLGYLRDLAAGKIYTENLDEQDNTHYAP